MTTFERIKKLAKNRGVTLQKVANKLGFGESTLYKWKNQTPNGEYLAKVADYFDVSVDYLIGRTDNKQISKENTQPQGKNAHTKTFEMIQREAGDYTPEDQEELLKLMRIVFGKQNNK